MSKEAVLFTLYVIALGLEVLGFHWTLKDIHAAREKLLQYFHRDRYVYPSGTGAAVEAFGVTADTSGPKTLTERVEALEHWRKSVPEELDRRDRKMTAHLETRLSGDLEATRRSVETQFRQVNEYLEGGLQSATVSYRGPIALLLGVIFGFCASLAGLTS